MVRASIAAHNLFPPGMILRTAGLIFLITVSFVPARAQSSPRATATSGSALLARAKQAEQQSDFAAAARLYHDYLKAHPKQPQVLQRLGLVYYLSNRFRGAIPPLAEALKLDPSLWGSALFLGVSYYRTGQFDRAEAALRRSLALKPGFAETDFWLGSTLLAKSQPEAAISYLRKASGDAQLGPQADSLLVQAYRKSAEDYYQRVAKLSPNSAQVHLLKAQSLTWSGNRNGALLEYQRALSVSPRLEGAHRAMGELYWQERQLDLAAKQFEAELRLNPLDEEANRRLGEYWLAKGDSERAIALLNLALKAHTSEPAEVYHFLGIAELNRKNLMQAEADLKLAAQKAPEDASNHHLLMQVYQRMGKPALAEKQKALFQKYSTR
ncbi:MAG TPA: tetratricopeptide repeat protein [Terriglobia bacterium]|nr:tetratricopeptide repeat protein [Terriglobia bacterium]